MSTQFNRQKRFHFKLFSLVKQFYFKRIQFSMSTQFYFKQFSLAWVHSLIVKNVSISSYLV